MPHVSKRRKKTFFSFSCAMWTSNFKVTFTWDTKWYQTGQSSFQLIVKGLDIKWIELLAEGLMSLWLFWQYNILQYRVVLRTILPTVNNSRKKFHFRRLTKFSRPLWKPPNITTKYKAWIHFKNSRSTYKNSLENICNGIFLWKSWIHGCVGLLQVYSTVDILLHSLQNILEQLFNKASRLEFCNIYKKTCVGVSIEEELFYRTPLVAVSTSKNVLLGIYFRSSICIIVPWPNQTNFTVKLWRVMIRIK